VELRQVDVEPTGFRRARPNVPEVPSVLCVDLRLSTAVADIASMHFQRIDFSREFPPSIPGRWGEWVLDWDELTLTHQRENYGFDLERFKTAAQMLDMIVQVRTRRYMTATDVGDFVAALDDLFAIQPSLTPMGNARRIDDVGKHLRRRIERSGGPPPSP
jgi:hypothetical protein